MLPQRSRKTLVDSTKGVAKEQHWKLKNSLLRRFLTTWTMHANGHAKGMQSQEVCRNTDVTELMLWQCKDKKWVPDQAGTQATESPTMQMPHRGRL